MTRVLPRTKFHSSQLIRCLADMAMMDTVDSGNTFAERLGWWVHFADAITLSAVLDDGIASRPKFQSKAPVDTRVALEIECDRTRTLLVNSIVKSCSFSGGKTHIQLPIPTVELPINLAAAYTPYRRFYEAHQRDIELSIQPVRVNAREAIARMSPRLKKLADLDMALEKILRERESKLLAKVPVLLKRRFDQLFKAHQQTLAETQQADNPANWMQPSGWLACFCHEMQMLLLAELELRLLPTMGLIEAFKQDTP